MRRERKPRPIKPLALRLRDHSRPSTDPRFPDCIEWTGKRSRDGDGVTAYRDAERRLHGISARRAAWWVANGELPANNVLTTCGNQACINPAHLTLGMRTSGGPAAGSSIPVDTAVAVGIELANSILYHRTEQGLADRFQIARGTVHRLRLLLQNRIEGDPPAWALPLSPLDFDSWEDVEEALAERWSAA